MRATEKQQDFVSGLVGLARKEEVKPTRFEALAAQLGLAESQWKDSVELRAFAEQYKNFYWVPERLLTAWHITTIWDEGTKPTKLVPDVSLDQLQDTSEEPSYEQKFF